MGGVLLLLRFVGMLVEATMPLATIGIIFLIGVLLWIYFEKKGKPADEDLGLEPIKLVYSGGKKK
jgi:hypothetical protein